MPDVASVLKQEITRLARKEVAAITSQQGKQIQILKSNVRDLKQQVASLNKAVTRLSRVTSHQLSQPQHPEDPPSVRINPKSIRKHRQLLKLTQVEVAQLLNVSTNSVVLWEAGKTKPRGENRAAIAQLRGIGVRDARAMLESLDS